MSVTAGIEISIPGSPGVAELSGYAVFPPDPARGMVVIHEIFGRAPEIDRAVERIAAAGYAAVSPDLFGDRFKPLCVARAVRELSKGEGPFLDQIKRAGDWLCAETGLLHAEVGVIGFCLGGGFALAVGGGFGAVSANYTGVPRLPKGMPPTIACYGLRDRPYRDKAAQLEKLLTLRGVPHEVHVFERAGHAFLTDGHHPLMGALTWPLLHVAYDERIAGDAWAKIFAFFDRHLRSRANRPAESG